VIAGVVVVMAAGVARADDVDAQIEIIEKQPAGMDRTEWKEKRREAAKKLGASGDKRAVPVLIDLVESETFDIIGEIAIEGLGNLGDQRAVEVLQKVANDSSRDSAQRDKAKKALKKLGAGTGGGDTGGGSQDSGGGGDTGGGDTGGGGLDVGGGSSLPSGSGEHGDVPKGPGWGDDVLAASERLTLAVGAASFDWNTVQDRLDINLDAASLYERTLDKDSSALAFGLDARVLVADSNPDGRASSRLTVAAAEGRGEYRAYWNESVYVIGFGGVRFEGSKVSFNDDAPGNDNSDRWIAFDGSLALGGGWGRVLDRGTRMRVARIATALRGSRQLGREIDDEVARRLQSAWWATRGELGGHRRLTATVAILRDAGILLGEPDAGTTYELLQILEDPAYDSRLDGIDIHFGVAENYLKRWRYPSDEDPGYVEGRLEELVLRARVGLQIGETQDITGSGYARYRLFAGDMEPSPWALGATARVRKFVYGDHYDAKGVLDLSGDLAVSDDDLGDATDLGLRLGGELGWTMNISSASWVRLAATGAIDAGEKFLGARLEAAYGLLDGSFASSQP
jgi:hypothetical protein